MLAIKQIALCLVLLVPAAVSVATEKETSLLTEVLTLKSRVVGSDKVKAGNKDGTGAPTPVLKPEPQKTISELVIRQKSGANINQPSVSLMQSLAAAVDSARKSKKEKQDMKAKPKSKAKKPKKKRAKKQGRVSTRGKKGDSKVKRQKTRKMNNVQPRRGGRIGFGMSREDARIIRKAKKLARKSKSHDPGQVNDVESAKALIKLLESKKAASSDVKKKKKISKKPRKAVRPRKKLRTFRKVDISKELTKFRNRNAKYKQLLANLTSPGKVNKLLKLKKVVLGKSKQTPKRLFVFPRRRQFSRRRWNIRRRPFSQRFRNRFRNQFRKKRPLTIKRRPTQKRKNIKKKNLTGNPNSLPPTSPVEIKAAKAQIEKRKGRKPGSFVVPSVKILKKPIKTKTKAKPKKRLLLFPKIDFAKELAKHRARNEKFKQHLAKISANEKGTEIQKGKRVVIGKSKKTPKRLLVFPRRRQNRRKFNNRRLPTRRRWQSRQDKAGKQNVKGKNTNTRKETQKKKTDKGGKQN